eukprot:TRINITY_DN14123_c0_g1_i2.p1 TRINITY_DN14123_c0_g1~~TRINITY_DN14123_c0_g1_i2.p1  ORF type:complete len:1045 (-),score=251.80 TRINITY_DN14123_c0_g1_i2:2007-5141(-)
MSGKETGVNPYVAVIEGENQNAYTFQGSPEVLYVDSVDAKEEKDTQKSSYYISSNFQKNWTPQEINEYKGNPNGADKPIQFSDSEDEGEGKQEASISDWDKVFGALRKVEEKRVEDLESMALLGNQFSHRAATLAKTIVAEQHISTDKKKIQPINAGGLAGGKKFEVNGLFFKYPVDAKVSKDEWLYGGGNPNDLDAAKACNSDIKGFTYFMIADKKAKFEVPLFALIDYQGFRLTVTTTLPLTKDTLVYGSNDAGKSMACDPAIHQELNTIAQTLNLRPHLATKNAVNSALCGDIEIHLINSKNNEKIYYALDLARLFPPASPLPGYPHGSVFFRMLRPELVRKYPNPLSSDGLSNWQCKDPFAEAMDTDIRLATEYVMNMIGNLKKEIAENKKVYLQLIQRSLGKITKSPNINGILNKDEIIRELHSRGINFRYTAYLVVQLNNEPKFPELVVHLMDIMVARVAKNYWRAKIQSNRQKQNEMVHSICLSETEKILMKLLNLQKDNKFWDSLLSCWFKRMFGYGIIMMSDMDSFVTIINSCRQKLNIGWIVLRFCQLCGIVLHQNTINHVNAGTLKNLSKADIVDFVHIIKLPPIIDFYTAKYYFEKARLQNFSRSSLALLVYAEERLENLINYPFPEIEKTYALVMLWNSILDRNHVFDYEMVIKTLESVLSTMKKGTKEFRDLYADYFCAYIWKGIKKEIEWYQQNPQAPVVQFSIVEAEAYNLKISLEQIGNKTAINLWNCITDTGRLLTLGFDEVKDGYQKNHVMRRQTYFKEYLEQEFMRMIPLAPADFPLLLQELYLRSKDWDIETFHKDIIFSHSFPIEAVCEFLLKMDGDKKEIFNTIFSHPLFFVFFGCEIKLFNDLKKNNINDAKFLQLLQSKNVDKNTLLHLSTKKNQMDVIQLLIDQGFNINIQNQDGWTALHFAVKNNNTKIIELLLNNKADINSTTKEGYTPLHLSIENGDLVSMLIQKGAKIDNVQTSQKVKAGGKLNVVYITYHEVIAALYGKLHEWVRTPEIVVQDTQKGKALLALEWKLSTSYCL